MLRGPSNLDTPALNHPPPLTSATLGGSPGHSPGRPQAEVPSPPLQALVQSQTQPRSPLRVLCLPLMVGRPAGGSLSQDEN